MAGKKKDEEFYDAVIIGAGPAGSEAAFRLAKAGFEVIVLEKDRLDREKPCGGGIQLKEILEFGRLPPHVIERKIRKIRLISPSNNTLEVGDKRIPYYSATVRRGVYDKHLQERAKKAGAVFFENERADKIMRKHGLNVVHTDKRACRSRLVIDAGGYNGKKAPETCITYHAWLKKDGRGEDIERKFGDAIEIYFIKGIPKGYAWIFPKKDVVSVGVGSIEKINLKRALSDFIRKHPIASKKLKGYREVRSGGGIIPLGIMPKISSGSSVMIGDAGAFANIIHGGGIYQARKSAKMAAEHCIKFLKDGNKKHLEDYGREAREFFEDYELRWDRKIRNLLWNENVLELLVERGKEDKEIKRALGIVLTSARSHEIAYNIMQKKMLDLVYSRLDEHSGAFKKIINSRLGGIFRKDVDAHDHANEVLLNHGAKRLRALIGILASDMFGGKRDDSINFSLIYEIFHTASLIHDDIMDDSAKRRGKSTLHAKYGVPHAIIAGDLMLSKGYSMVSKFSDSLPKEKIVSLLDVIGETGERCCIGQSMDISMAERNQYHNITIYLKMIELKTGSLIEGSVKGGAVIAGASREQIERIGGFGRNMGMAFQIIDDSLDLLGGKNANKSVMNDIKQGKATPMLIYALKKADRKEKDIIRKAVGKKNMTKETGSRILEIYKRCGAIQYTQRLSKGYIDRAREELMGLPEGEARDKFMEILDVMGYWSILGE